MQSFNTFVVMISYREFHRIWFCGVSLRSERYWAQQGRTKDGTSWKHNAPARGINMHRKHNWTACLKKRDSCYSFKWLQQTWSNVNNIVLVHRIHTSFSRCPTSTWCFAKMIETQNQLRCFPWQLDQTLVHSKWRHGFLNFEEMRHFSINNTEFDYLTPEHINSKYNTVSHIKLNL